MINTDLIGGVFQTMKKRIFFLNQCRLCSLLLDDIVSDGIIRNLKKKRNESIRLFLLYLYREALMTFVVIEERSIKLIGKV